MDRDTRPEDRAKDEQARQEIASRDDFNPSERSEERAIEGQPVQADPQAGEPREPGRVGHADAGLTTAALAGTAPTQEQVTKVAKAESSHDDRLPPLLADQAAGDLRNQWNVIQTGFVDSPRQAVEQADNLVAVTMKKVAETFANERSNLERQWDKGDQISTEDLRLALQRYRSFFQRLLSV